MNEAADNHQESVYRVGYYAVCLIDILGQQERLARWSQLPSHDEFAATILPEVKKTAGTVLVLKEAFENYFQQLSIPRASPELLRQLTQAQRDLYRRAREYALGTQQFGDTFIFYAPIATSNGDETTFPLHGMLLACCMFMTYCLACKVPLRGSVCIGSGVELEPGVFYGPALAMAHHLESRVAEYPRIVVSPEVVRYLDRGGGYSQDRVIDGIMAKIAASSRRHMAKDNDGCMKVDFLGEAAHELADLFRGIIPWDSFVADAYGFTRAERDRFHENGDKKLEVRYERLMSYFDSNRTRWKVDSQR